MTRDQITELAKEYEGDDKLGCLTNITIKHHDEIIISHNRSRNGKEIEEPRIIPNKYWCVDLRYASKKGACGQTTVNTGTCKTLEQCYLILLEYLKVEVIKVHARQKVMTDGFTIEDDNKLKRLQRELKEAIDNEDYEQASFIKSKINDLDNII